MILERNWVIAAAYSTEGKLRTDVEDKVSEAINDDIITALKEVILKMQCVLEKSI